MVLDLFSFFKQVFALLLRPNKDHKYRIYWNIDHHSIGYSVIIMSIINRLEQGVSDLQFHSSVQNVHHYQVFLVVIGIVNFARICSREKSLLSIMSMLLQREGCMELTLLSR